MLDREIENIKRLISKSVDNILPEHELQNFVLTNSKMIRSKLALLWINANNAEVTESVYKILTAGELIHNASLLHDDVIDSAQIRRNLSTIGSKFSDKISILSGNYLVSAAINNLLSLNNFEILNIFNSAIKKMNEAEVKQFFHKGTIPNEDEYLEICSGKTASLFCAILESCAIISDIPNQTAIDFANLFGICFQIKNDLNPSSSSQDNKNKIHTAKDVLGIENTKILLDNYKEGMINIIKNLPASEWSKELESLIREL